jgi:signal transduction histidine kinase
MAFKAMLPFDPGKKQNIGAIARCHGLWLDTGQGMLYIYLIMSGLILDLKLSLKYSLDVRIILVALLYYFAARLGYLFAFENSTALPAWPPSGIAFALIILLGRQTWPGITIGSLLANIMAYWNNANIEPQTIILISSLIALCNTFEAVVGNYLVKNWIKSDFPFKSTKNAYRFLFVSLLMCLVGAALGTWGLYINQIIDETSIMRAGFSWWVGNVVGILLFTPFILSFAEKITFRIPARKMTEVGIFFLTLIGIYLLLQVEYLVPTLERALPFLVLPFLLWLAFRFDLIVAITGILLTSLISIYFTIQGEGPFNLADASSSMLLLQIFMGVMSISTIILSATVKERLEVQTKLQVFNENLETMVLERTSALKEEISSRKKIEEKIQRTNQELSKRNSELDNFVYSVSHDLRAPIASVLGLINLAKKDIDIHMKDMYLDMIHKSTIQQDLFIKEILDQSRNSRLEIKREEILFQPLIDETFNQLRYATNAVQSVEKVIKINQEQPFFSDRWRLKVILNNLISNAIRYRNGRDPVIRVNVYITNDAATLAIEDNGKGIEKDHLPNIYKMFYRATDDGAGSGLGLYIVKEAIEKLNGNIDIESEVGKGTRVKLQIPALT